MDKANFNMMWCIILVNIIMSLHNVEVTARVLLSVFFSIAIQLTIILVIRFVLIFVLPLSPSALLLDLSLWVTWRVSYNKHELHTLPQNVCSHSFWVFLGFFLVLSALSIFLILFVRLHFVSCAKCCKYLWIV